MFSKISKWHKLTRIFLKVKKSLLRRKGQAATKLWTFNAYLIHILSQGFFQPVFWHNSKFPPQGVNCFRESQTKSNQQLFLSTCHLFLGILLYPEGVGFLGNVNDLLWFTDGHQKLDWWPYGSHGRPHEHWEGDCWKHGRNTGADIPTKRLGAPTGSVNAFFSTLPFCLKAEKHLSL